MQINPLLTILLPVGMAALVFLAPSRVRGLKEAIALIASGLGVAFSIAFLKQDFTYTVPWAGFGFDFSLRIYSFSSFIMLAVSAFVFLVTLYSTVSLSGKEYAKQFLSYLILTLGFVNGAVMADNLIALLFFWEGLLLTLFGMIVIGSKDAFKTATKAFIIVGVTDLCMMVGIALSGYLAHTLTISKLNIPIDGLGGLAFLLLMIGTISKAGSMPFHSWIPDAAVDAPLPFMAIVPGAIEKLVGIYFLTRLSLDMFQLTPESWISYTLMTIGAITIILAVMMALIQKDYKRLLSYHAISQVGYMILGIGTLVPVGIVGGLFHMLNNAMYKSCLFLTGGSVEKQTGTTDLSKLGGIGRKMPITFACFILAALAISGVPPFNGFFSKELVYDGALERGWIFYIAAALGSFFTAASFLKLGHAAFLGKAGEKSGAAKESSLPMLIPMVLIAVACLAFGIWNAVPIEKFIQPAIGHERLEGHSFAGFPTNMMLVIVTFVVLAAALLNHLYGVKKTGKGLGAVDHIHYAPGLSGIYDRAEKRFFDPYNIALKFVDFVSWIASSIDKAIDWLYNVLAVKASEAFTNAIKKAHNGSYRFYILWSLVAAIFVFIFMLR